MVDLGARQILAHDHSALGRPLLASYGDAGTASTATYCLVLALFAVVALIKVVTLFTALWAGPLLSLATDAEVHLGPDAGPSLLLVVRWLRSIDPRHGHPLPLEEGDPS